MKVANGNFLYAGIVFVAAAVLFNTLPVYAVFGIFALGCIFAAFNPDNAK